MKAGNREYLIPHGFPAVFLTPMPHRVSQRPIGCCVRSGKRAFNDSMIVFKKLAAGSAGNALNRRLNLLEIW
jgi:hypothetical protein